MQWSSSPRSRCHISRACNNRVQRLILARLSLSPHHKICVFFRTLYFAELIYRQQQASNNMRARCAFKYSLDICLHTTTKTRWNHLYLWRAIPQDASQAVVSFHHSGGLSNCIIWEGMEISFYPEFCPSSVNFQAALCLPKSFQT